MWFSLGFDSTSWYLTFPFSLMQSLSLSPAGEMENPCLWDQRAGLWSQHGVLPLLSRIAQVSIFCLCLWRPFLLFHSARYYNITANTLDHLITLNSPFSLMASLTRFTSLTRFADLTQKSHMLEWKWSPGHRMLKRTSRWSSLGFKLYQASTFPFHENNLFCFLFCHSIMGCFLHGLLHISTSQDRYVLYLFCATCWAVCLVTSFLFGGHSWNFIFLFLLFVVEYLNKPFAILCCVELND